MSLTKVQRDLLITAAIGGSVLLTVGGAIVWSQLPAAPVSVETTSAVKLEPPSPAIVAEVPEPVDVPVPEPEPVDPVVQTLASIESKLEKLGIPNADHLAVARVVHEDSWDAWNGCTSEQQYYYCIWMVDKLHQGLELKIQLGAAMLYANLLREAKANPGTKSVSDLILAFDTLTGKQFNAEAAKMAGAIKTQLAENEARAEGRVVTFEVLSKSVEYGRGELKIRITNNSADVIDSIGVQVEMTLLGKHVGLTRRYLHDLLPQKPIIEVFSSDDKLEEGFDDYSFSIVKQPAKYHAANMVR